MIHFDLQVFNNEGTCIYCLLLQETAQAYEVKAMPTFVFIKNMEEVIKHFVRKCEGAMECWRKMKLQHSDDTLTLNL